MASNPAGQKILGKLESAVTLTAGPRDDLRVAAVMRRVSYAGHRFPPVIIQHAVSLCFRFALSYRDVEDLLVERGVDVSFETVRRWTLKSRQHYAEQIRKRRQLHAYVSNHFNEERSLSSRPLFEANRAAALAEWRVLCAE